MTEKLSSFLAPRVAVACIGASAVVLGAASASYAVDVHCGADGGDATGWAVATGGDFDGDGVDDIVVGAPCAFAGGERKAGRVLVFSGLDGSKLFLAKGSKSDQRMGAAVDFISDIDGDGRDDVVVGSFGWHTTTRTAAGRIDVFGIEAGTILSVQGDTAGANFGEAVVGLGDVTGDGIPDIGVGAGDEKDGPDKKGMAYLLSGADGSVVDSDMGDYKFDGWGGVLGHAGDVNGDQIDDIFVASNLADVPVGGLGSGNSGLESDTGVVRVLSGLSMEDVLVEVAGLEDEDNLGRAVSAAGPLGFFAGSPSAEPTDIGPSKAGVVELFSWAGEPLMTFVEPLPDAGARFGTGVCSPGDLDGDGLADLVAAATNAPVDGMNDAGRVHAMSSADGSVLWSMSGGRPRQKLGHSIAGGPDFDADGVADAIVGSPGDDPNGRRGAGSVTVVSGVDGSPIMQLKGRRGLETRMFVTGWRWGRVPRLEGFNRHGRRRKLRTDVDRRLRQGQLSLAVLDDSGPAAPGMIKVVVGTGHGGDDDSVRIYRADRRGIRFSEFRGIGGAYAGGVSVAAGNVIGTDSEEELVVAQADSENGYVFLKIYQRFDEDPFGRINWFERDTLLGFAGDDVFIYETVEQRVDADGVNVAVGDLVRETGQETPVDEIVIGPADGAPVVRVLDNSGNVLGQWIAYFAGQNRGTTVATGDLDGDGVDEVVTAPANGLPWIKAFSADGTPFVYDEADGEVSFFAFAASATGGVRIAVADVDLDGEGEIICASGPGISGTVRVFEADGTLVEGWKEFMPFGPISKRGLAVAATDRFLRH